MESIKTIFSQHFFILFTFLISCELIAQENFIENIVITPSTCSDDNGSIQFDEPPSHISIEWNDGNTNLIRNDLPPGPYTISGEDENGCIETLIVEVPDFSDCDFELVTWELPAPLPSERGPVPPCVIVGFVFTLNGIPVSHEFLNIQWTVTVPISTFPYSYTYFSSNPTIPVYTAGTILNAQVSLNYGEQILPCCSFSDQITITNPSCRIIRVPQIFVYKSTFRNQAQSNNIPGLIELVVYGDSVCGETMDIRGFIIDDNNGELIPSQDSNLVDGSSLNVDPGYIRFANHNNWAAVPNGSIITIYESDHPLNDSIANMYDPTDSNYDYHYIVNLDNVTYFEGYSSQWDYNNQIIDYSGSQINPSWELIEANGGADAMQVRYPEGDYCHGFSFGKTSTSVEENWFPLHLDNVERDYCQIHMQWFSYLDKSAFNILEVLGGFIPGQIESQALSDMLSYLRSCDSTFIQTLPIQSQIPSIKQPDKISSNVNDQGFHGHNFLNVYPNPFTQLLKIEYQSTLPGNGNIKIYNSQGRMLNNIDVECAVDVKSIEIDFGLDYPSGLFLIQFQSPDNQILLEKAILINLN